MIYRMQSATSKLCNKIQSYPRRLGIERALLLVEEPCPALADGACPTPTELVLKTENVPVGADIVKAANYEHMRKLMRRGSYNRENHLESYPHSLSPMRSLLVIVLQNCWAQSTIDQSVGDRWRDK